MSTARQLCIFVVSLILLSICAFFNPIRRVKAETWVWYDDFASQNSRWNWAYAVGTGYHLLTTIDGYSVVENGITSAATQYVYSDCALRYSYGAISASQPVTIEIRAKFSHSMLQGAAKGSQGLIIWNGMSNFAGFFDCSVETQAGFTGLRAVVMSDGVAYANEYLGDTYDPRNWHVYRIVLKSDGTALYVDGDLVAQATQRPNLPSSEEVNLWVDNAAYTLSGSRTLLDVTEDQKLYLDYVAWSDQAATVPSGSIIINDGDAYTTSTSVTLSLTYADASAGVSQVRYSNDGVWDTESWESPVATKAWTLTLGDGAKTVYYQVKNFAELISPTYSDTIVLDTVIPTGSVAINNGDAYTSSTAVTLALAYSDSTSGVGEVRFSDDGVWDTEAWEPAGASKSWVLSSVDGPKTVYFQVRDNAGLTSITYSDTIVLDTAVPVGSVLINNGDASTYSVSVTLALTYADATSGVSQVRYSNDGMWDTEDWESPAGSKPWTLALGEGTKVVYFQVKDNAGLLSSTYSDTITLVMSGPTGSVVINYGDAYTASTSVTLSLAYSDAGSGVSQVRYSNDGVWDAESWEAPAASKAWSLTSGDGMKMVYFQIKDNAGLLSSTYSDTVNLVTAGPTVSVVIASGDAGTSSVSVTLSLTYSDSGSGVSQVRYGNDGVWDTEVWEVPAATRAWTLPSGDGAKTVYYQTRNNLGVLSSTYSDTILLDTSPPAGSIIINDGSSYTNTASVMLSLTASDATSGIGQVRYSNDGVWDTEAWEAPSSTKPWELLSGDGDKTVYYQARDNAGLVITVSDSITLDMTKPTANAGENQTVDAGDTANFSAGESTDNVGIASYAWNFGDGATGTGISASHVYLNPGNYTVSLTVEDAAGNIDAKSVKVAVQVVIPEFPSTALLSAFIAMTSALALSFRRKHKCTR